MRRRLFRLGLVLTLGLALFALADLRHRDPGSVPQLIAHSRGTGTLSAGVGQAHLEVPYPAVVAGYGPRDRHEVSGAANPPSVWAVALQSDDTRLTLFSVDLLEVDSRLPNALAQRMDPGWGQPWVCATHTHTGLGGYDPNLLAQLAGTGRFDARVREAVLDAMVQASREAWENRRPVSINLATAKLTDLLQNRDDPAQPVDDDLLRLTLKGWDQSIEILRFAAHPTLVPRSTTQLDGDFPAHLETGYEPGAFERHVRFFLQGAVGDAAVRREVAADPAAVAEVLEHRLPPLEPQAGPASLEVVRVEVPLPPVDVAAVPAWSRRAVSNLADRFAPRSAPVSVLRLGRLTALAIPGEPTFEAEQALLEPLRRQAQPGEVVTLFGLCNGYVGYVDSAEHVKTGEGEAARTYFGPELLSRLRAGAELAIRTSAPLSAGR